jgi:hypothetical protein
MKIIKYQLMTENNRGTEENPDIVQTFNDVEIQCGDEAFESNYAIAQAEAYNGEITVEDILDEPTAPTQLDQIEAQVAYTAMMTDTLLEV